MPCHAGECWNCGEPQFDSKDSAVLYKRLSEIIRELEKIKVATQQAFSEVLTAINDSTNQIAATLDGLKKKIEGAGMDSATEDAVLAQLQTASDKLKGIAAPSQGTF